MLRNGRAAPCPCQSRTLLNEVLSLNAQEFAAGIVPEGPPPSSNEVLSLNAQESLNNEYA